MSAAFPIIRLKQLDMIDREPTADNAIYACVPASGDSGPS